MNEVRFIKRIASSYSGNVIKAIEVCIKSFDIPMNVRCPSFDAVVSNEAYLDMMRRSREEFLRASIVDCFHPDVVRAGHANDYLRWIRATYEAGGGDVAVHAWNGREELFLGVEIAVLDGLLICGFRPISRLRAVSPGVHQEALHSFRKANIVPP